MVRKEVHHVTPLWSVFIFLGVALLTLLFVQDYTGFAYYRDFGYGYGSYGSGYLGGFSNFDIVNMYYEYAAFIDAFLFLLLFLGIGRSIFGEHFKGTGGKAVYTSVGLMLALGLLLWEAENGISIIGALGPVALLAVFFLFAFVIFSFMHRKFHAFNALCFTYALLWFVWDIWLEEMSYFDYGWVLQQNAEFFRLMAFIALALGVVTIPFLFKKVRTAVKDRFV